MREWEESGATWKPERPVNEGRTSSPLPTDVPSLGIHTHTAAAAAAKGIRVTWVPQGPFSWCPDIPSQACVQRLPTVSPLRALELIAGAFLPQALIRHPPEGRLAGKDVPALCSDPAPCVPPVSLLQSLLGAPALRMPPKLFDRFEKERLSPADMGMCPHRADIFFITLDERFAKWRFYMSACWMDMLQGGWEHSH